VTAGSPRGFHIPWVAFFGRTLAEYLAMFAIDLDELRRGSTLDCPSGPDSFVAEAREAGCDVLGCDPLYALDPDALEAGARANVNDCLAAIESQEGALVFADYAAFRRSKLEALDRFLDDYRRHRESYVAASLPGLPFGDGSFDRVLGANFLFAYAHASHGGLYEGSEFDLDFHLRSVEGMARVARSEIRLVPMGSFSPPPRPHDFREPVAEHLRGLGFRVHFEPARYDSGLGAFDDVLVARR